MGYSDPTFQSPDQRDSGVDRKSVTDPADHDSSAQQGSKEQVEFVARDGRTCYAVLEKHKGAIDAGPFLTIQPEDGSPPTRVKPDSPEAAKLRELYPELDGLAEREVA